MNSTCLSLRGNLTYLNDLPSFTLKICYYRKTYFEGTIEPTADQVLGVNIDIEGLDGTFGFVGSDSFTGISFPEVDFGLGGSAEEQVTVVVKFDDINGSFVTFKNEGFHVGIVYC